MNALRLKMKKLSGRFDTLQKRERLMILFAGLVTIYMGWEQLFWIPQNTLSKQITNQLSASRSQLDLQNLQLKGMTMRAAIDPNSKLQQELQRETGRLSELETKLAEISQTLIPPRQMVQLLEQLLLQNGSLELISLKSLNSLPLLQRLQESQPAPSGEPLESSAANIFQHAFIVEFEGDYLSVLGYLQSLESLPWHFFWDGVEVQVKEYPVTRVRLQIHTLSLSEGWVGV